MTALSSLTVPELAERVRSYWAPNQAPQVVMVDVAELARRADCGGVNCGKCQQCLTVDKHFALQAIENLKAQAEALAETLKGLDHACTLAFGEPGHPSEKDSDGFDKAHREARDALARYRGEKP